MAKRHLVQLRVLTGGFVAFIVTTFANSGPLY